MILFRGSSVQCHRLDVSCFLRHMAVILPSLLLLTPKIRAVPDRATDTCQGQWFFAYCNGSGMVDVASSASNSRQTGGGISTASSTAVILMQSAQFGRMQPGRCGISNDLNGQCSVDVLWYLDRRCSGRRECKVYVADTVLHAVDQCRDLKAYLEARYTCVTATELPIGRDIKPDFNTKMDNCHHSISISSSSTPIRDVISATGNEPYVGYLTGPHGHYRKSPPHVTSMHSPTSRTGSSERNDADFMEMVSCPLVIEALPGQRVLLTLAAFGGGITAEMGQSVDQAPEREAEVSKLVAGSQSNACYEFGLVASGRNMRTTTGGGIDQRHRIEPLSVCGPGRGVALYQSHGHLLSIRLHPQSVLEELAPFLIKFEVTGCAPIAPPTGGWVSIDTESQKAVVGCNMTDERWHLTCSGTRWNGAPSVGNCTTKSRSSTGGAVSGASPMHQIEDSFPYGVLLVVAIGVALGVFIGGILLTVVALLMKKRSTNLRDDMVNRRPGGELDLLHSTAVSETYSTHRHQPPHHLLQQQPNSMSALIGTCRRYYYPTTAGQPINEPHHHHPQQMYHQLPAAQLDDLTHQQQQQLFATTTFEAVDDELGYSYGSKDVVTPVGVGTYIVGGPGTTGLCVVGGCDSHLYQAPTVACCVGSGNSSGSVSDILSGKLSSNCGHQPVASRLST